VSLSRTASIGRPPLLLATVGLVMVGLIVATIGQPPSAASTFDQTSESIECPVMTDSVKRLYEAFFNRSPSDGEFLETTIDYRSGEQNLEQIAQRLAESDEFETRYGNLSNERFVDLVYRNVLRRAPSDENSDFWTGSLADGLERGAVMMAFSESEEFVRRTDTATPLSGYLRWYPEGTHWYCGVGARDNLRIKPLTEDTIYADYVFFNGGDSQSPTALRTVLQGELHLTVTRGSLPPGFTNYKWGGAFDGNGNYGSALDIEAGKNTSWIAVFYPSLIGEQRLGWQIEL
jgi:hypothetical protein